MRKVRLGVIATISSIVLASMTPILYAASPITNGLLISVDASSSTVSGTTWSPSDGTTYPATLQSSAMYTSPNGDVAFGDASNQYADFGDVGSTAGDISVDMWVYIGTMHTSNWNIIATKWFNGAGEDWHFGFYQGKLRNYFYGTNYVQDTVNGIGGTGWYHAAFSIKQPAQGTCPGTTSSGTSSIYLNGVQVGTVTSINACHITSSASRLVIGDKRASALLGIDGAVAKFRFYHRALSESEINRLYRADAARFSKLAAPYNSTAPSSSGSSRVGSEQRGSNGSWLNGVSSYSYRWFKADVLNGAYAPIAGATNIDYSPVSADLNKYLKLQVTAANAQGSMLETSTATLIGQGQSNLVLTTLNSNASHRTVRNLTLAPGAAGKVTFENNGKRIAGCIGLSSNTGNGFSVTCPWKPSVIGFNKVIANFISSDSAYPSGSSPISTIFVQKRSGNR